ncbi:MAG: DUF3618 domain-containing protein [Actinomycetota bacterium]
MGANPQQTQREIEQTREELARKVDELVVRARVEAAQVGKKVAIATLALAGIGLLGILAKRRVQS